MLGCKGKIVADWLNLSVASSKPALGIARYSSLSCIPAAKVDSTD